RCRAEGRGVEPLRDHRPRGRADARRSHLTRPASGAGVRSPEPVSLSAGDDPDVRGAAVDHPARPVAASDRATETANGSRQDTLADSGLEYEWQFSATPSLGPTRPWRTAHPCHQHPSEKVRTPVNHGPIPLGPTVSGPAAETASDLVALSRSTQDTTTFRWNTQRSQRFPVWWTRCTA